MRQITLILSGAPGDCIDWLPGDCIDWLPGDCIDWLWFIRNIFYVPKFTPKQLLLKLSGLNSIFGSINFGCQNCSSCQKPV